MDTGRWNVEAFDVVDSTNERVKAALRAGCAEGYCAFALRQTDGYGRQGRAWASPVGGLYASFGLRPPVATSELPTLSLAVSLAVRNMARREGVDACIKWPNDVLCGTGKLCGISLEAEGGGVCVGIGVNVFRPKDATQVAGKYEPAYLFDEKAAHTLSASQRERLETVFATLLDELDRVYGAWSAQGFPGIHGEYREHLAYVGDYVALEHVDGRLMAEGFIEGVAKDGSLLVRTGDWLRSVVSGEVHVREIGRHPAP